MNHIECLKTTALPLLIVLALGFSSTAIAAKKEKAITAPPVIYTDLIACKTIADSTERLACFDEKVAAFEAAQTNSQIVIADREQVREARRGLFGLSLPRIKLFSGSGDEGDQISQIEGEIASVRGLRGSKWLITLKDGARWQQTAPARSTTRTPKSGDTIVIKRSSLGSFLAKVNGGRGFKVKRVN